MDFSLPRPLAVVIPTEPLPAPKLSQANEFASHLPKSRSLKNMLSLKRPLPATIQSQNTSHTSDPVMARSRGITYPNVRWRAEGSRLPVHPLPEPLSFLMF